MKPRRRIAFVVLLATAAVFVARNLHKRSEPVYDGKPLSYWLHEYCLNTPIDSDLPEFKANRDTAASAIRSIGTNALPQLVAMAKSNSATWQSGLLMRLPNGRLKAFIAQLGILPNDLTEEAGAGFMILGTNAQEAIPDMVKLMADKDQPLRARQATVNLSYLGPRALPFLITEMSNNPATEHYYYEWLITNNVLPTVTSPQERASLLNTLRQEDDHPTAYNAHPIVPDFRPNLPAH